ncbi:MAG: EamA family transporter [Thermomicrobiales bacterium]
MNAPAARAEQPGFRFLPELAQLTVVFLWASTFIFSKFAFAEIAPLAFLFARFAIMITVAVAVMIAVDRGVWRDIDRRDVPRIIAAGLSGYGIYQILFVVGLSHTSPFSSSLLVAMVPLFTVIILAIMGEPTPRSGWIGLGVALVGVAIFLIDKRGESAGSLVGDLLSMGSGLSFAIYGIINRPLVRKYPVFTITGWSVIAGGLPVLVVTALAAWRQPWGEVSGLALGSVAYMAIFPVYIAYILWNFAIEKRGVAQASSVQLLVPIVTGVASALILGEPFGPLKLIGAALAMTGLLIIRLPGLRAATRGR